MMQLEVPGLSLNSLDQHLGGAVVSAWSSERYRGEGKSVLEFQRMSESFVVKECLERGRENRVGGVWWGVPAAALLPD